MSSFKHEQEMNELTVVNPGLELQLRPGRAAKGLVIVVSVLVVGWALANVVMYYVAASPDNKLAMLTKRVELGHEPSLRGWYLSLAPLTGACLLVLFAVAVKRNKKRFVANWVGLMILCVLMAIDEIIMIHEMVDTVLKDLLQTTGFAHFPWVFPAMALVAVVGFSYIGLPWHLEPRTRRVFCVSAGIFVFGAEGMEMCAAYLTSLSGVESIAHTITLTIEEGCQMLGIVLFIYAFLDVIERHIGSIQFRFSVHESEQVVKPQSISPQLVGTAPEEI